jgi:hypothetical protein
MIPVIINIKKSYAPLSTHPPCTLLTTAMYERRDHVQLLLIPDSSYNVQNNTHSDITSLCVLMLECIRKLYITLHEKTYSFPNSTFHGD